MRKILTAFAGLLAACSTPAYRASEVPVPTAYGVDGNTSIVANRAQTPRSEDASTPGVYVSANLASAPFWTELGDTTLALLVREGQRANMDVRIAQSRVTSARATRRLAALDLIPTVTGTSSTSRSQLSLAQTPGLNSQLPTQQLWDVGFDASWELDFFGRVGRNVKAQGALAESSERGFENVQVIVAAEV
ncbi:MAG TPA: TolC family protein, partial [Gemmatimonadaceae bacterium]|nr:TolC family protein [Gemmatimonadaceae bacterium]